MTDLNPFCMYEYSMRDDTHRTNTYTTKLRHPDEARTNVTMALVLGDMGSTDNSDTLNLLYKLSSEADLAIHLGDFGYNLEDDNGKVGDTFFGQIEPIATQMPYMGILGNHERHDNFTHYKTRFNFPKNQWNQGKTFTIHSTQDLYTTLCIIQNLTLL